jgi:glucokinase
VKAAAGLVGDVGGTNARFAMVDVDGKLRFPKTYPSESYASLNEIIEEYVTTTCGKHRPHRASIAVAGPVVDGETQFTNLSWTVSRTDLVAAFEFEAVSLMNDFAAQALAAPVLEPDDLRRIGPELRSSGDCPIAVLGPGTGFGVAALARTEHGDEAPLATEAAHAGFAPYDEIEVEVWRALRAKYGRVSTERVLSGQGLYDLYGVMAGLRGLPAACGDEKAVHAAALAGDELAIAVLDRFCEILGGVAGDLALAYGARGGVFIGGGIAPRLLDRLAAGGFRRRFEDKGRLSDYVAGVPTQVIVHPYAALVGAARELEQMETLRL